MNRLQPLFFSLFIALLCSNHCLAQKPAWLWAKAARGNARSVINDSKGNVYVAGSEMDSLIFEGVRVPGKGDVFIAKYDRDGKGIWMKRYGVYGGFAISGINVDRDDNIYISGEFLGSDSLGDFYLQQYGIWDVYVAKLDHNGEVLWARAMGGKKMEDMYTSQLGVDKYGNVYFGGSYEDKMTVGNTELIAPTGGQAIYLVKYDKDGNNIWAKSYDGPGVNVTFAVTASEDGDVYMGGIFVDSLMLDNVLLTEKHYSHFISKHDKDGNLIWVSALKNGYCDAFSIAADKLGNVYTTGRFTDSFTVDNVKLVAEKEMEGFLLKHDKDGKAAWARSLNKGIHSEGSFVLTNETGHVFVSGAYKAKQWGGFINAYDTEGNLLWEHESKRDSLGLGIEKFLALSLNKEGNVHAVGEYMYKAVFDSITLENGYYLGMAVAKMDVFPAKVKDIDSLGSGVLVYPNPAEDVLIIRNAKQYHAASITDISGRIYRREDMTVYEPERKIDISSLPAGVYFLRLHGDMEEQVKFIKR